MTFDFVKAQEADKDYLLQLRKLTMVEHLEKSGQFLSEEEHRVRINDKYHCAYLLVIGDVAIGTIKYERTDFMVTIMQIQIHPDFQRRGFGRGIIQQVLSESIGKTVTLTVLKDNPALKLYQQLGFKITGEDEYEYHMQIKS